MKLACHVRAALATSVAAFVAPFVMGCATSQAAAPRELVDARAAYNRAASGPAATYDPSDLHVAKKSLERAEQWYREDSKAAESRTQAYLAMRRAQTADAQGHAALALARTQQAERALVRAQGQKLNALNAELDRTRGQLSEAQRSRMALEGRAMAVLEKQGGVRETPGGKVITLPGAVLFETGKADLMPSAKARLGPVAQALKDMPNKQILVEGFTDNTGTDAVNQPLSEARARAVKDSLTSQGVPEPRVQVKGMGSNDPIASNDTIEGRATNRRVELVVLEGSAEMQDRGPTPSK
jgi:outer membrane protein OmpA-like peptidoglycan-associated protein